MTFTLFSAFLVGMGSGAGVQALRRLIGPALAGNLALMIFFGLLLVGEI